MYYITCDGYPLLDWRDNGLILVNPTVKLEVNTVGEGSFTIYKTHPHYDRLKKLKSVVEVSDENGVIFRGRATGDTVDFDHGMAVDLEGAMAFFNDSVVRPFLFPSDFKEDADYVAAAQNGNVIAFLLGWLIDNHNAQVQDEQKKMKLGRVTVTDPNNYITRSNIDYASTWETLKGKLFDSSLGGYLCIRYEADGNYIDYLSEFTETNSQRIEFGENLLDLKSETESSEAYSAVIPLGAAGITIAGLADGDINDDLVKSGDTIYSKKAVAEYGWIYAPTAKTTWEDVTNDTNLRTKGAEWLANGGALPLNAIEVTAVDLHFTDKQVESLRIYKNVEVHSGPHDLDEVFPLSKLEIDLLNPQNTKIQVGRTMKTLTDITAIREEEAKQKFSQISKNEDEIRLYVTDKIAELETTFVLTTEGMEVRVQGVEEAYMEMALTLDGFTITDSSGTTLIKGSSIDTSTLNVDNINIDISGRISFGDLTDYEDVQSYIDEAYDLAAEAWDMADSMSLPSYIKNTYIDAVTIKSPTIEANDIGLYGGYFNIYDSSGTIHYGSMGYGSGLASTGETTLGVVLSAAGNTNLGEDGNYFIATNKGVRMQSGGSKVFAVDGSAHMESNGNAVYVDDKGAYTKVDGVVSVIGGCKMMLAAEYDAVTDWSTVLREGETAWRCEYVTT